MPYPIVMAAAAVLAGAGTGMQIAASEADKAAIARAQHAEAVRQKGYQKNAGAVLAQSEDQSTRQTADQLLAGGEAARMKAYQDAAQTPLQALPTGTTGNSMVLDKNSPLGRAEARSTATGNAWNRLMAQAQARMGSYEDWGLANNLKNTRASQALAIESNLARGSANILPAEVGTASHTGDELAGWGQLVSALGAAAGTYGAGIGAGIGAAGAAGGTATTVGTLAPAAIDPQPVGGYGSLSQDPNAWSTAAGWAPR